MQLSNIRLEVMQTVGQSMDELIKTYLKSVEENWQPTDMLPDATNPEFIEEVKEIYTQIITNFSSIAKS